MLRLHATLPFLLGAAALLVPRSPQETAPGPDGDAFFREEVLPILRASCFECHGPAERNPKGGFALTGRDALLAGGDTGPAVVPGDPDASLIIQAVRWSDELLEMPPEERLAADDVATLERWVELGAPWPVDDDAPEPSAEDARFFEETIRPLLADNCFECHGPDLPKVKGGLRMTGRRALLRGGLRGPAIVPGEPAASLLIKAVRRTGADVEMPPSGPLPDRSVKALAEWIRRGAPWPTYGAAEHVGAEEEAIDVEAGRSWWAFRPVERPEPPPVEGEDLVREPIDRFVLARLEAAGIEPNPPATKRELVRRAYFDLIGLPPTYEEVERFVADDSPTAWTDLIDALLARPEYGERWGRRWLDVVRFAQTNGYERDAEKPFAWRYRDYVIDAFNADKPFDRFVVEQLAGDELDEVTPETVIATGFHRIGVWDDEPDDKRQAELDDLDDVLRTVGEGFLGVTLACARCHDHKFDPFPQEDYYRLLAFLRSVRPYESATFSFDSATLTIPGATAADEAEWERARQVRREERQAEFDGILDRTRRRIIEERLAAKPTEVQQAFRTPPARRTPAQRALVASAPDLDPNRKQVIKGLAGDDRLRANRLTEAIALLEGSFEGDFEWALSVRENGPEPVPTRVLVRGKAAVPGDEVQPGYPRVLVAGDAAPASVEPTAASTGARRALAEWIASPENPLTARVLVNRLWQGHFGRGLVPTPNDFGRAGVAPTHPLLLDRLAADFVEGGWSVKAVHRRIMSSYAYRMSSRADNASGLAADEANDLLWRQRLRRLDAEEIRDAFLAISGELNPERGGRGFFPTLSREALAGSSRPGQGWEPSPPEQRHRRAVYAFVKRTLPVPLLEVFDQANPAYTQGARNTTTIASQALTLLNGSFAGERADAFAARVMREADGGNPAAWVTRAFELALARRPTGAERDLAAAYLADQAASFTSEPVHLAVKPLVPERVDAAFLDLLAGEHLLFGPRAGWTYAKGEWGNGYNGTVGADELRGPAALAEGVALADGEVEGRLRFDAGARFGSLLLRAAAAGDVTGLELRLLPADGRLILIRHDAEASEVVAEASAPVAAKRWLALRVELRGERARVWLDGAAEPSLESDGCPPAAGTVGLKVADGGLELDGLTVRAGDDLRVLGPDDPGSPEARALALLCLTLLNLNETVYVD